MTLKEQALGAHKDWHGKLEVKVRTPLGGMDDLRLAYTPGVAEPCKEIAENPDLAYLYTRKGNMVAVVTDGTAVLGLGDIGPLAGLPVMEGKAVLFKHFADVDAIPILIDSKDVDVIVETVKNIAPGFGGINLEDIGAPRCFEVEKKLKAALDIPVFHDDQHGTAIVVLAALTNALKLVKKPMDTVRVVMVGAGAAGIACANLILSCGVKHLLMCDKPGILRPNDGNLDAARLDIAQRTNPENVSGSLADALVGADVFIGVSAPNVLTADMVRTMNEDAIVFAMANPAPEIDPLEAKAAGARVVGTGRSDFPNQINNLLAFPGVFRGALDVRAKDIDEGMKIAAAKAIASLVAEDELSENYILPRALDPRLSAAVAKAVREAAREAGLARV